MNETAKQTMLYDANKKSLGVSYLLWFFLGVLGGHRFYNGRTGTAIAVLALTLIGWGTVWFGVGIVFIAAAGIWVLVDAFLIPSWVRQHNVLLAGTLGNSASEA